MRAQTSIEFIIIMAAVAGMSVAFIYAYAHASGQMNSVYGYLNSTESTGNPTASGNEGIQTEIYAYITPVINQDSSGTLEVILAMPQNASSAVITPASGAFSFYPESISLNYTYSPYIAYFRAIPRYAGNANLTVKATITIGNSLVQSTAYASAYVALGAQQSNNTAEALSASLSQRNASVLYGLSQSINVPKLVETSHCTYLNFWYTPLSFQDQCGNAAWDFSIFSDSCYDAGSTGATYCVYKNPTGYATQNATVQDGYTYNLTLGLRYGNSTYISNINSNGRHAALLRGNTVVGNVTVSGQISGQSVQLPSAIEVMDSGQSSYPIGIGAYSTYGQYMSSASAKLGYYNGTGVGSSEFSSIQQGISSYNSYLGSFLGTDAYTVCNVISSGGNAYLSCPASSALDFSNITVDLYNGTADGSVQVDGSTVYVR